MTRSSTSRSSGRKPVDRWATGRSIARMGEVTIRRSTLDDVEARVDVYIAVATEGGLIGGEPPLDRDELIKARRLTQESDDTITWVAEVDGRVIGDLTVHIWRGRGNLGMALLDGYREQGIGTRLMEACIVWARDAGLDKLWLEVWPRNARAIALYEKMGFAREGYHPKQWRRKNGEAWDTISMGLVLE